MTGHFIILLQGTMTLVQELAKSFDVTSRQSTCRLRHAIMFADNMPYTPAQYWIVNTVQRIVHKINGQLAEGTYAKHWLQNRQCQRYFLAAFIIG